MAEPAFVSQALRDATAERASERPLRRAVMVRPVPELRVVSAAARVEPAQPRGRFAVAFAALRREFELWRWRRSCPRFIDD